MKRATLNERGWGAVCVVPEKGITDVAHVNPYLMRAACFELQSQKRQSSVFSEGVFDGRYDFVMGGCMFAVLGDAEASVLVAEARDGSAYGA